MIKTVMTKTEIRLCDVCSKEQGKDDGWMFCYTCGKLYCPTHSKGFLHWYPSTEYHKDAMLIDYILNRTSFSAHIDICPTCLKSPPDKQCKSIIDSVSILREINTQLIPIVSKAIDANNTISKYKADYHNWQNKETKINI